MSARNRYFEWLDGETLGSVSILEYIEVDDGEEYYHFTDGEEMSKEFISKMTSTRKDLSKKLMVEVQSPEIGDLWTFEEIRPGSYDLGDGTRVRTPAMEELYDEGEGIVGSLRKVPPQNPQSFIPLPDAADWKRREKPVEPKPQPAPVNMTVPVQQAAPVVAQPQQQIQTARVSSVDETDPVSILVKTSKKTDTKITINLVMSLPSKDLFSIAVNQFDDGERKFIDTVVSGLDVSDVIESIKNSLRVSYRKASGIDLEDKEGE